MKFIIIGIYGIILSITTFIRGKPDKIFPEVYWGATILLFNSCLYLLVALFNPDLELNWFILGVLFLPSMALCAYTRECWYKEKGRKRPWWDL